MEATQNSLSNLLFIGAKETLILPDSSSVEIRENNGEDEGKLSRLKDAMAGTSVNNYLSSIITQNLTPPNEGKKVSPVDILNWKINCKNFTLVKARILSLGETFKFVFQCPNTQCNHSETFIEDLVPHVSEYNEETGMGIKPYPLGLSNTHQYIIPSSGRNVKFDILNGVGEKASLDIARDNIDKNHGLLIRNLHIMHEGKWEKVYQFGMFSSKELVQLRAEVSRVDPEWDPTTRIVCPKCNRIEVVPILSEPAFFYPTEI